MNKLVFKLFHRVAIFLSLLVVTFFIISCMSNVQGSVVAEKTQKSPEVYFCPREDCGKVFEENIRSANFSVHCAVYDINLKNAINALSRKSRAADVKVVIDNSNNHDQIKGPGIREDSDKQLMHNKFCVVDDKIVLTGSFNPTDNDNYKNNNNLIVVHSKFLSENYEDEFNELWNGIYSGGSRVRHPVVYLNGIKIENYFCPEDHCMPHIVGTIKGAKSSVYFMDFSFTSREIADAIIMKKDLDTKGVVDSGQSSGKYSQLERLQEYKINVIKDRNKYKMHHKVFIIDNETFTTGSFNPTLSGDERNDENILIIHDKNLTSYYLKEFDEIFSGT